MNNEPVAWMVIDVDNGKSLQFEENKFSEVNIPLYTHPVKELTDEEIKQIAKEAGFTFIGGELVFYEGANGLITSPNVVGTPSDALKQFAKILMKRVKNVA